MKNVTKTMLSCALAICLLLSLGGNSAFAAENYSRLVEVNASGQDASQTIGSIHAVIDDPLQPGNALSVQSEGGHTANVTADSVSGSGGFPTALFVCSSDPGSRSDVTVANGISAEGEDTAFGIAVSTFDGGAATIRVSGGVNAKSDDYAFGLHARSFGAGTIQMDVSGEVYASGSSQARGVVLTAPESGSASLTINGKLSASSSRDGAGAEIDLGENAAGELLLRVNGDLTCNDTALLIQNSGTAASATIVVDGTIKGGNSSVVLAKQENTQNLRLIAWKISRSSQGATVETMNGSAAGEMQKAVSYIVRVAPAAGATLRIAGVSYEQELGLYTAHEGDQLTFYADADSGYRIAGVYNGEHELTQNSDGGYSLTVPRGGGVDLHVVMG